MESNSMSPKAVGSIIDGKRAAPYNFVIMDAMKEAWHGVNGFKATYWGAVGLAIVVSVLISLAAYCISSLAGGLFHWNYKTIVVLNNLIIAIGNAPLIVGLLMLGVHRAAGMPVKATQVLNYYHHFFKIFMVCLVAMLILFALLLIFSFCSGMASANTGMISGLLMVVSLFLLAFAIYLGFSYIFAMVLAGDKPVGVWTALELSRRAVTQHWFKIFFTFVIMYVLVLIASIPLLIGLIWVLPMANILFGVFYRTMFGVNEMR